MLFLRWNPFPATPGPAPDPLPEIHEADEVVVTTSRPRTGLLLARCFGELDLHTAPSAARALAAGSAELRRERRGTGGPAPVLVCELAGISFCGAAGLRVLLDLATTTAAVGTTLVLAAPSRSVRRVLDATATGSSFTVRPELRGLLA